MKIRDILQKDRPTISFEVFPPKTMDNYASVEKATMKIAELQPDFMSITYGAGGGNVGKNLEVLDAIKASGSSDIVGVGFDKSDAILNLIREGKTHQISAMMQAGGNAGMHTLNMDLSRLMRQGYITKERAREYTNNPAELEQYMM